MREDLKERNLKILTSFHEKSSYTNKLKKEKIIEISEEMKLKVTTIKRVIDVYYEEFVNEICTKNTELGDLTKYHENLKFDNLTEKQTRFLIGKLFGLSSTRALKQAGYKSKGSLQKLNVNKEIQEIINRARLETLKTSKYTFNYNYELLGKIAREAEEGYEEKEIKEKHSEENGQELSKRIIKRKNLPAAIMAIAAQNKMMLFIDSFYKEEKKKSEKRIEIGIKKMKS